MAKKPKEKPIHSNQLYSEDTWFEEVCRLKDKAEAEGNMAAVARFVEIIARRKGFIAEAPERQTVLSEAQRREAQILAMMRFHPRVVAVINAVLAEGGYETPVTPPKAPDDGTDYSPRALSDFGDFSGDGAEANLEPSSPDLSDD